jgi:hypothetical protein
LDAKALKVMKQVKLYKAPASGMSMDERYIVEVFDDVRGDPQPVALGYALFQPHGGVCSVNVVSRGTHDDDHAQAALAAFQEICRGCRKAPPFTVRPLPTRPT